MLLPGADVWDSQDVTAQIAFQRNFAASAERLAQTFNNMDLMPGSRGRESRSVTDSIFALGRAAELAFATENVSFGLEICREIADAQPLDTYTPMQLAFYAAATSVVGKAHILLRSDSASISPRSGKTLYYQWPTDDSAYAAVMMRIFLPAAAASGQLISDVINRFHERARVLKPQAIRAFELSDEFQALSYPTKLGDFQRAMENLEANFTKRLSLMRYDTYHWKKLQLKGSLIDWPLLCLWVGILRFGYPEVYTRPRSNDAEFIRWLAAQLYKPTQ
jgi:hypothetical protein